MSRTQLTAENRKRLRIITLSIAAVCILYAVLFQQTFQPSAWMTYRDFDVPGQKNFINYLNPGVDDLSSGRSYDFEHPHTGLLLGVLFGFFPLMFVARVVFDLDFKLKVYRYLTQWLTFVVARLGIFRVTGVCPVKRTALGVFPFINCQSCELATGACPLGTFQMSLLNRQIPFLVIGQILLVGLISGRWICGWLCPYGFLSDIFEKLHRKPQKPSPGRPSRIWSYSKYGFLAIFLGSSVAYVFRQESQVLFYCAYLCPAGFYYGVLEYALTTGLPSLREQIPLVHVMLLYHFGKGLVVILMSIRFGGRFFCKHACPMGAMLGLFNKIALYKVRLNHNKCTGCQRCSQVCPMQISPLDRHFHCQSSCITCGRCVQVCPTKKIEIGFSANTAAPVPVKTNRGHNGHKHRALENKLVRGGQR